MSRVGKQPIKLGAGVKLEVGASGLVRIEGPKGKLTHQLPPKGVAIRVESGTAYVELKGEAKNAAALRGVTRAVVHNLVHGVSQGYVRELDIVGVGYRAAVKGDILSLNLGFSHQIDYKLPQGIVAKVDKNTHLVLEGADKVLLGMVASEIRGFRPPEPYQGKGVKYTEERIVRKQGKAAGAK